MKAKEYLSQAYRIERILKSRQEQIARLESLATSSGQSYGGEVHGSHDPTKGSKVENLAVQLVELKDYVGRTSSSLIILRKQISGVIARIGDLSLEYVLEERYLNNKTWDEISFALGVSTRQVLRYHGRALEMVTPYIPTS